MTRCDGCDTEGSWTLSCPTCRRLAIQSVFCGQTCFTASWDNHKVSHEEPRKFLKEENAQWLAVRSCSPKEAPIATRYLEVMSRLGIGLSTAKSTWGLSTLTNFDPLNQDTWKNDLHLARFSAFRFTGELRPWPLGPGRHVPSSIPRPDYAQGVMGIPVSEQKAQRMERRGKITVCDKKTVDKLRECCRVARQALDVANRTVKVGATGEDVDRAVHEFIVSQSGYPSPLNYYNFPKACCVSVNEVICHGVPDLRPFEDGDIVNVDVTVFYKGVHGDLNETYIVGDPAAKEPQARHLVEGAYECLQEAIKLCKPGTYYREIGARIHDVADSLNLCITRSYCGHGIHHLFHCSPEVPHYRNNRAMGMMKEGHVFTIEPMINLGTYKDRLWPDNWTAVTQDGKWSAQFEHTLVITADGCEALTARLPESPPLQINSN